MDSNKEPNDEDATADMAGNDQAGGQAKYSPISKWIHFGKSLNTSYSAKCISAVIVIDYLYRYVVIPLLSEESVRIGADKSLKGRDKSKKLLEEIEENRLRIDLVPHPLSVIFSSPLMVPSSLSKQVYSRIEDAYNSMCQYWYDNTQVTELDKWITYRYKLHKGCYILRLFTLGCVKCENTSVSSSPVTFAADNWEVAEQLTATLTKKTCTEKSIAEAITTKLIETSVGGTKKSSRNKTALNQDKRRRQKRLRGLLQQPNEHHQEEDNLSAAEANNNKEITTEESTDSQKLTETTTTGCTLPPLFSGLSKPYMGRIHYPFIVVETFNDNETGNVVKGDLEQGVNSKTVHRESVLGVETTNSYCYYFKRADLKPHMVVDANQAKKHLEAAQNNRVTTTIVYSNSLKKEFKLPDSEFMFWSELTREYQQCFGKEQLKFDLDFWHIKFDSDHSEDNLNRGFTEYFDGGYGRDGVMENTYTTQQRGKQYVSALPSLINDTNLYFHFGCLMDCIQHMADMHVRDEGKLLHYNHNTKN